MAHFVFGDEPVAVYVCGQKTLGRRGNNISASRRISHVTYQSAPASAPAVVWYRFPTRFHVHTQSVVSPQRILF